MANIHVLAGVPSFSRWPLDLHFLSRDAHKAWEDRVRTADVQVPSGLGLHTDFPEAAPEQPQGVHALPLDYTPLKAYVAKVHEVMGNDGRRRCVHCREDLRPERGLYAMCPGADCVAAGHVDCWSRHALAGEQQETILPDRCSCPSCGGEIRWVDMMKELSLRTRGQKDVENLLKEKRKRKAKSPVEGAS